MEWCQAYDQVEDEVEIGETKITAKLSQLCIIFVIYAN